MWGNGISSGETRGLGALNWLESGHFRPLNPKTGGGLNPLGVMQQMDRQMGSLSVLWEERGSGSVRGQISQIRVVFM